MSDKVQLKETGTFPVVVFYKDDFPSEIIPYLNIFAMEWRDANELEEHIYNIGSAMEDCEENLSADNIEYLKAIDDICKTYQTEYFRINNM